VTFVDGTTVFDGRRLAWKNTDDRREAGRAVVVARERSIVIDARCSVRSTCSACTSSLELHPRSIDDSLGAAASDDSRGAAASCRASCLEDAG
jgi:hypothetical protein